MKSQKSTRLDAESIIEEYADMVYRIAYVQMKNKADAEDVFQEVFLRLVKNVDKLKGPDHVKPWLIRVTINCCKTQFNSGWKRKTTVMENYDFVEKAVTEETFDQAEDLLDICFEYLNKPQITVIHLFYFEGYSIREISQLLGQSESAVKTRLSRARDLLRTKLKGKIF